MAKGAGFAEDFTTEFLWVNQRVGKLVTLPGLYSTSADRGFPGGASVKNLPANAGDMTDTGSIPG